MADLKATQTRTTQTFKHLPKCTFTSAEKWHAISFDCFLSFQREYFFIRPSDITATARAKRFHLHLILVYTGKAVFALLGNDQAIVPGST